MQYDDDGMDELDDTDPDTDGEMDMDDEEGDWVRSETRFADLRRMTRRTPNSNPSMTIPSRPRLSLVLRLRRGT